ncbi:ATP-binding protein [Neobacillus sp. NPDC058068]|uniref:ATP-binding protein n=1 Tax=Neobacillus sp. NPDC058068 TaxID=3346325 RepID=UPI0036DA3D73
MSPPAKKNLHIYIYMLIAVPLAGELNFYPFNDSFRISFGMPTFFFFLILLRKYPAILSGTVVGISVVAFRILLDLLHHDFTYSFQHRYPTFFYYFTFGGLFYFAKANRYIYQSILIGFLGIIFDILASSAELTSQYVAFDSVVTRDDIRKISVIAIFRSFFTIGIFNLYILYETRLRIEEMQKQNEHQITVITNLYEEAINLRKTLINSENTTRDAYNLYRSLKNIENKKDAKEGLSQTALKIAGQTHDIKKDNQRILSGLSRLIADKDFSEYMEVNELLNIAVKSNWKYANLLGKDIEILLDIQGKHPNYHIYKVLSIMNNIVGNAIEAIKKDGIITINVRRDHDIVEFQIRDNGPGIAQNLIHLVFKPGFTTKYDSSGRSSTGIGLTYVRELVEKLEGEIILQSEVGKLSGSYHKIRLPICKLTLRG